MGPTLFGGLATVGLWLHGARKETGRREFAKIGALVANREAKRHGRGSGFGFETWPAKSQAPGRGVFLAIRNASRRF